MISHSKFHVCAPSNFGVVKTHRYTYTHQKNCAIKYRSNQLKIRLQAAVVASEASLQQMKN